MTLQERIRAALEDSSSCCLDDDEDRAQVERRIFAVLQPLGVTKALLEEFATGHPMPRDRLESLVRMLRKEHLP
jgi:hypothetical protein